MARMFSSFDPTSAASTARDALDVQLDAALQRQFVVPVAPLPLPPGIEAAPTGAGGGLIHLLPALALRDVAGLILATTLLASGGYLIHKNTRPFGSQQARQRNVVEVRKVPAYAIISQIRLDYHWVNDRPTFRASKSQPEMWLELGEVLWGIDPATQAHELGVQPGNLELLQIHQSGGPSHSAVTVTARVGGVLSVAIIDRSDRRAHIDFWEVRRMPGGTLSDGLRLFLGESAGMTVYELNTSDESILLDVLLGQRKPELVRLPY